MWYDFYSHYSYQVAASENQMLINFTIMTLPQHCQKKWAHLSMPSRQITDKQRGGVSISGNVEGDLTSEKFISLEQWVLECLKYGLSSSLEAWSSNISDV